MNNDPQIMQKKFGDRICQSGGNELALYSTSLEVEELEELESVAI